MGNFFVAAEIQSIEEPYRIFEALRRFERISRVSIYLHPANPDLTDVTRRIHSRLKQLGADTYAERYEAGKLEPGLQVVDDTEVTSKISMAEDGYGKAEVTGTLEGEIVTVTTADSPLTAFADGDEVQPEVALEELLPTIRRIFARFGKTLSPPKDTLGNGKDEA